MSVATDINSNYPAEYDSPDASAPTPPPARCPLSTIVKPKISNTAAYEPEQQTQSDPTPK